MQRFCFSLFVLTLAPPLLAQSPNATAAQALFSDGKRLMDEGHYDAACPKLAESQRLDPGTGTLLNLAQCYEKDGKYASSWAAWLEAAASARTQGQPEREALARERARALEPFLGRLTITVQTAPEARPAGLKIEMDGLELSPATWGTPLPADKGNHVILVSAPGYKTFRGEVSVLDGQSSTIAIPELPLQPREEKVLAPAAVPASAATPPPETDEKASAPAGRTQRILGWVGVGLGAVGVGVGSAFGAIALSKNEQSLADCDPVDTTVCNSTGLALRNEALSAGDAATVSFIVGGVLVAGGVTLLLTAPKNTSVGLNLSPEHAQLSIGGHF